MSPGQYGATDLMAAAAVCVVVSARCCAAYLSIKIRFEHIFNLSAHARCHFNAKAVKHIYGLWSHAARNHDIDALLIDEFWHSAWYMAVEIGILNGEDILYLFALNINHHKIRAAAKVSAHLRM